MSVELEANQKLASDNGENETKDDAHHPCRKIRSENIKPSDNGENETKDDAHHPCRKIRSENIKRWRMSCHFWWDAEAEAGLARSPTLSAKAAALV